MHRQVYTVYTVTGEQQSESVLMVTAKGFVDSKPSRIALPNLKLCACYS